jgi:transglutaminase-like putative cysteine protease
MRRRRAIACLGATACLALFLSGGVPAAVPLACLAGIVLEVAVLAPAGRRLPAALVVGIQGVLAFPFVYLALLRDPPVEFLALLLTAGAPLILLRSFHPETQFNDFLIVLLSLLLVVGSAAVAPGVLPIAITALYVLVACQALPILAARPDAAGNSVRFRLERPAGWWAHAPAIAAHHLAVAGLALGCLLYLVAPRPDLAISRTPLGDRPGGGGEGREGSRSTVSRSDFPRDIRMGDIGRLKRRTDPALEVEIRARGRPYDPAPDERSMLLLRARAWEEYLPAERRWERPRASPRAVAPGGVLEPGETELDWSFEVLGYDGLTIFLPPRSRRVRGAGGALAMDRLGVVTSSAPVLQYAVASARPVVAADLADLETDATDRRLLRVPDAVARVLGPHLPRAPRGDLAWAAATVAGYFRDQEFRYTLDLPAALAEAPDPLEAFLKRREGHCELYATTACLFLRLLGVPARVAGGLRCAERMEAGRYRARFSNAHAWVEVACKGVGFVPLDFTPADSAAVAAPAAAGTVGGAEAEGAGGDEAHPVWRDPFTYGPEEQERVLAWLEERVFSWPFLSTCVALLLLLVVPPVVAAARRRPRSPLRVTAPPGCRRSTLSFYARWLKECAAKGHVRARQQTPREFLATLPPEMREVGGPITAEFERCRYGG